MLFAKLGARDNAERLLKDYTDRSINLIEKCSFKNKNILISFANNLLSRNK